MGVTGLWGIIEPAGKAISLEALENKTLAVDVSIWLHQAVKGFRDKNGQSVQNAHLLGLFHRICKLLTYRIKPVFVFDGGVPALKTQTMASRRKRRDAMRMDARETGKKILENYLKQHAVSVALGKDPPSGQAASSSKRDKDDVFTLPEGLAPFFVEESDDSDDSGDEDEIERIGHSMFPEFRGNIHDVDVTSEAFLSLPATVRHEILLELKDSRKQNSWNRIHEMPRKFDDFSNYQVERLLKRRRLQETLQNVETEIGSSRTGFSASEEDKERQHKQMWGERVASDATLRVAWYEMTNAGNNAAVNSCRETSKQKNETVNEEVVVGPTNSRASQLAKEFMSVSRDCTLTKDEMAAAVAVAVTSSSCRRPLPSTAPSPSDLSSSSDDEDFIEVEVEAQVQRAGVKRKHGEEDDMFADVFAQSDAASFAALDSLLAKSIVNQPVPTRPSTGLKIGPVPPSSRSASNKGREEAETPVLDVASQLPSPSPSPSPPMSAVIEQSSLVTNSDNVVSNTQNDETSIESRENDQTPSVTVEEQVVEVGEIEASDVFENSEDEEMPPGAASTSIAEAEEVASHRVADPCSKEDEIQESAPGVEMVSDTVPSVELIDGAGADNDLHARPADVQPSSSPPVEQPAADRPPTLPPSTSSNSASPVISRPTRQEAYRTRFTEEERKKLEEIHSVLERERSALSADFGKIDRVAATMSEQIYFEAQELLRLFGIPFITAPMEAEAQCAFLDVHNLTQGTITDDSDIWLFGGRRVYKNLFNPDRTVEYFEATSIRQKIGLGREALINFAFLCGSDYCEGLPGVGAVSALELIATFPGREAGESLKKMKDWWDEHCNEDEEGLFEFEQSVKKLKKADLSADFPAQVVIDAYLKPQIDESTEKFLYSVPDLTGLRDYLREKLSWPSSKTDEMLLPVLKRMDLFAKQTRIDSYFAINPPQAAKVASKRVQKVINLLTGTSDDARPKAQVKRPLAKKPKEDDGGVLNEVGSGGSASEPLIGVDSSEDLQANAQRGRGVEEASGPVTGRPRRRRAAAQPKPTDPLVLAARNVADPIRARIAMHLIESSSKKKETVSKVNPSLISGADSTSDSSPAPAPAPDPDPTFKIPGLPVRRSRKAAATFVKPKTLQELQREREKEKEESRKKAAAVFAADRTARGGKRGRGRGRGGGLAAKRNRTEDEEPEYEPNLSEGSSSDED